MAIWYEVDKTEQGISNFLGCNWEFHDFRQERIEYIPGKDMVEIFLKYDTMDHGVLLRFAWIHDMHINTQRDYDAEWLDGSVIILLENGSIIWLDDDGWGDESKDHLSEMKAYTTWVESDRLFWCVTDANGNPVNMPDDRIDQEWNDYGTLVKKHFILKDFNENWDDVLKPWYNR